MKKFLIGCLVILLAGAALLGVGAYYLYRAASPVIQNARQYLDRFAELGELEKQIRNQSPFTPPQSGELSKDQVERFARVQEHVRRTLGRRFDEIDAKYKDLKGGGEGSRPPPISAVLSALGELGNVVIDARRAQVDALNQERFSSSEYAWVRARVYQAAGVEMTSAIDFQKVAEAARKGTGINSIEAPTWPMTSVPEKNRELVKPYVKRMDEWVPLLFFGL